jgi:Domain of unknown function (DUF6265)
MQKNCMFIGLCFLLMSYTGQKKNPVDKLKPFNWLIGSWTMQTKEGVIAEHWTAGDDSTLTGRSEFIKHDKTVIPSEELEFSYRSNNYSYIVKWLQRNNKKPVAFRVTSFSDSSFVSENQEHNFPRRIIYQLIHVDTIHAWIDAAPEKPEKRADFYYVRKK